MLGTLIFEWDAGAKEAKLMLNGQVVLHPDVLKKGWREPKVHSEGKRFYARRLAEVAKSYGFDGYLMNFECQIKDTDVLLDWLVILKEEIRKLIPEGIVIWYDSVLHDGQLRWQSALNDKNYRFFQATDGFFTDYHW
jgi:mannosyl-glycoprotein endo-beta-N-acetylglucosaminidase